MSARAGRGGSAPPRRPAPGGRPLGRGRDASAATGDPDARMTPAVRRLLREHGLSPEQIAGTGGGGRITRDDVLAVVESIRTGGAGPGRRVTATSREPVAIPVAPRSRHGPGRRRDRLPATAPTRSSCR